MTTIWTDKLRRGTKIEFISDRGAKVRGFILSRFKLNGLVHYTVVKYSGSVLHIRNTQINVVWC